MGNKHFTFTEGQKKKDKEYCKNTSVGKIVIHEVII